MDQILKEPQGQVHSRRSRKPKYPSISKKWNLSSQASLLQNQTPPGSHVFSASSTWQLKRKQFKFYMVRISQENWREDFPAQHVRAAVSWLENYKKKI